MSVDNGSGSAVDDLSVRREVKSCIGAAIQGSSLLSTLEEVRSLFVLGQKISINGGIYTVHEVKLPTSWPAKCIELSSDFVGTTDFNAKIEWEVFASPAPVVAKKKSKKPLQSTKKDNQPQQQSEVIPKPPSAGSKRVGVARSSTDVAPANRRPRRLLPIDRNRDPAPYAQKSPDDEDDSLEADDEVASRMIPSSSHKSVVPNEIRTTANSRLGSQTQKSSKVSSQPLVPTVTPKTINVVTESPSDATTESTEPAPDAQSDDQKVPHSKAVAGRKTAHERVLQRIQLEKERIEREEKAREERALRQIETNELKVQRLREKTLERVQALQEEEKFRLIDERSKKEEAEFKKFAANEAACSTAAQEKMRLLRKEAAQRKRTQEQRARELAAEEERIIAERISANARRFVPIPVPPKTKRVTAMKTLNDTQRDRANASMLSQLSQILGEDSCGGDEESNEYLAFRRSADRRVGAENEPIDSDVRGMPQNERLTLSAHNLLLLQQQHQNNQQSEQKGSPPQQRTRIAAPTFTSTPANSRGHPQSVSRPKSDRAPRSDSSHEHQDNRNNEEQLRIQSARHYDEGIEAQTMRLREATIGRPQIAFHNNANIQHHNLVLDSDDHEEDSLADLVSPPQKKLTFSPLKPSQTRSKNKETSSLHQSPKEWLDNELRETNSDLEDAVRTVIFAKSKEKKDSNLKNVDSDSDSDLSDLTDIEATERSHTRAKPGRQTKQTIPKAAVDTDDHSSKQRSTDPKSVEEQRKTHKKKSIFRKLPPIPIAPYQPVAHGSQV